MAKINYKSDFDFILRLKDGAGHDLGFPDYGWEAMFWTSSKASPFKASCFGGVCKNCYDDEGQIHIVADNHNLGIGTLKVEFRAELPREIYPDDYQRNVMPEPLGIELIREKGELSLTDSAKRAVFNDMFDLAAGSDGGYKPSEAPDPAKPYLLNTLWLSYEEAVKIYAINGADAGRYRPNISRRYSHYHGAPLVNSVRTLFKVCGYTADYGMFFGDVKLEVVNVYIGGNLSWVFRGNSKLKTVLGTVEINAVKSGDTLIWDCALLEDVNLKGLRYNIRMLGCPKLSLATMQYLVDNASTAITAEKPVVVTVPADVFAKLTGDMTNEAAAALTDDEKTAWAAVLTAATSKYISFATD